MSVFDVIAARLPLDCNWKSEKLIGELGVRVGTAVGANVGASVGTTVVGRNLGFQSASRALAVETRIL